MTTATARTLRRVARIVARLERALGRPRRSRRRRDALQVLVLTILSQNTTDVTALRAYERLLAAFPPRRPSRIGRPRGRLPRTADGSIDKVRIRMSQAADALPPPDWEAVRRAPLRRVTAAVRVCGLGPQKAATIRRVLDRVKAETSAYRLEPLVAGLPPDEAIRVLAATPGVGVKTAAVVLMEALGADVCPVDTHLHRVCVRLGLAPTSNDRNRTFAAVAPVIPKGKAYAFHHALITLGRTICVARAPRCPVCPLKNLCPSAGRVKR
jgi:endonuclease-3